MSATPQDVLREAARILMRDGWRQGGLGRQGGPRCQLGAMVGAAVNLKASGDAYNAACDRLADWLQAEYDAAPIYWNDAPERTAEDVILALKRAAEAS